MTTRTEQIVYLTEWANRYGATLQTSGEVGFGRPCVGIEAGDHYVDTEPSERPGEQWWEPEDSYHKHDCLSVLDHGDNDRALTQLYDWVKWLEAHGYGVEVVYRKPGSQIDLMFHGVSRPRLVKLSGVTQ